MLIAIGYSVIAILLLTTGGNAICRAIFTVSGLKASNPQTDVIKAGRVIGWLERLIIALGLLAHSWEVLAAVIALKTVGRFKELDEKLSAEYFLVGSLFSFLWSVVVTGAWIMVDTHYGSDLSGSLAPIFEQPGEH